MNNGDKPAYGIFKTNGFVTMAKYDGDDQATRITKREWFAGMAMQGIVANSAWVKAFSLSPKDYAEESYKIADAMLKEEE